MLLHQSFQPSLRRIFKWSSCLPVYTGTVISEVKFSSDIHVFHVHTATILDWETAAASSLFPKTRQFRRSLFCRTCRKAGNQGGNGDQPGRNSVWLNNIPGLNDDGRSRCVHDTQSCDGPCGFSTCLDSMESSTVTGVVVVLVGVVAVFRLREPWRMC